jgi:N-acetylglutamate synthase-like GNAT family acetyltransferase
MSSGEPENADKSVTIRPLTADDLASVVAIDREIAGRPRESFFSRRLDAALKSPGDFIYVGACTGSDLKGFALVRLLTGEFGQSAVGMLDALSVDPASRGAGIGRTLMARVEDILRHKGIRELQTEAIWTNGKLLAFFAHAGFERAPQTILTRGVAADLEW